MDTFFVCYLHKINAFIQVQPYFLYYYYSVIKEEPIYHFMNSVRLDVLSSDDFDDSRSYSSFTGNNLSEMDLKRRHTNTLQKEEYEPFEPLDYDENGKTQKPARLPITKVK